MKFSRWSENGTIQKIFEEMQAQGIIDTEINVLCLDSISIKVHPDVAEARKKNGKQSIGLSLGNCRDAPQGRKLIDTIYSEDRHYLLMDRAYEDDETCSLAEENGFVLVVHPKRNRKNPWKYDKELYKRRKHFRKVFTRYDKLDSVYISIIHLAMIFDALV